MYKEADNGSTNKAEVLAICSGMEVVSLTDDLECVGLVPKALCSSDRGLLARPSNMSSISALGTGVAIPSNTVYNDWCIIGKFPTKFMSQDAAEIRRRRGVCAPS